MEREKREKRAELNAKLREQACQEIKEIDERAKAGNKLE